jgi:hypothetical protein
VPASCDQRLLWTPSEREYPFAIVTDETNVYWIAQSAGDGGDAYNGSGLARVLRGAKVPGMPFEIASQQAQTTTLVLDGDFAYWAVLQPGPPAHASILRRARRDCDVAPCAVEDVTELPDRAAAIVRAAPGKLALVSSGGDVVLVDVTVAAPGPAPITKIGFFPALSATDDAVYVAAGLSPFVRRYATATGTVTPMFAAVPDGGPDASAGVSPMTNDCDALWGLRQRAGGLDLLRFGLGGGTASNEHLLAPSYSAFAMAADARYVYFVSPFEGVYSWDKTPAAGMDPLATVASGNVWNIAVDNDGVYWGDHAVTTAGSIHMLVK